MSSQTRDPRLETLLRDALTAEVSNLPVTVGPEQILERRRARPGAGVGSGVRLPRFSMMAAAGTAAVMIVVAGAALLRTAPSQPGAGASAPASPVSSPSFRPSPDGSPTAGPEGSGRLSIAYSGEATLRAVQPWAEHPMVSSGFALDRDYRERLELFEDPSLVATGCEPGPPAANLESLVQAIRSDPGFAATDPVSVGIAGREGVRMDVTATIGWDDCEEEPTGRVVTQGGSGSRMRLYLLDAPDTSASEIYAISILAPRERFGSVIEAAQPVIDSIEFNTGGAE